MSHPHPESLLAKRLPWLILAGVALALEAFALVSQHLWGLEPCNECVLVRFGVLGLFLASVCGALFAHIRWARFGCGALVVGALGYALTRAAILVDIERQVAAGLSASCGRFKGFPGGVPLHQWLPEVFEPRAMCGQVAGTFLGQSFAVWTLAGLAALSLVVVVVWAWDVRRA